MLDKIRNDPEMWNLFTSMEEYDPPFTDRYGRFPHYLSSNKKIFEPSVSNYLVKNGICFDYPDSAPFALCITHDIDIVYERNPLSKGLRAFESVKSGRYLDGMSHIIKLSKRSPWWNFSKITDIEKKFDAKSTFFFMALNEGEPDWNYNIYDLEDELRSLYDEGWGIGLHGGHSAYLDAKKLKKEKANLEDTLGHEVIGYRNHYLRFKVPDTWEILNQCGFKYDATFGYADCAGFRNGMCHPFRPYNMRADRQVDILEIPLTIMDVTLSNHYMRLAPDAAWQLAKSIIDTVERCNGVITLLWHNTQMFGEGLTLYNKILEYCACKKAWLTSCEEISRWFQKQS